MKILKNKRLITIIILSVLIFLIAIVIFINTTKKTTEVVQSVEDIQSTGGPTTPKGRVVINSEALLDSGFSASQHTYLTQQILEYFNSHNIKNSDNIAVDKSSIIKQRDGSDIHSTFRIQLDDKAIYTVDTWVNISEIDSLRIVTIEDSSGKTVFKKELSS